MNSFKKAANHESANQTADRFHDLIRIDFMEFIKNYSETRPQTNKKSSPTEMKSHRIFFDFIAVGLVRS
jgi:hypothetical protein